MTQARTTTNRPTYKQDWPAYSAAQANERHKFLSLAHDLCQALPAVQQGGRGRPPLPLSDTVFSALLKVYDGKAARRTQCALRDAYAGRYLTKVPHYNAIPNMLENPALTPILHDFITRTSLPLTAVEVDFAADSSGFTGPPSPVKAG